MSESGKPRTSCRGAVTKLIQCPSLFCECGGKTKASGIGKFEGIQSRWGLCPKCAGFLSAPILSLIPFSVDGASEARRGTSQTGSAVTSVGIE